MKQLVKKISIFFVGLFSYLPVKKRSIIFESQSGVGIDDSPKAIYDYLNTAANQVDLQLYWSVLKPESFASTSAKTVKRFSLKWFLMMFRADVFITNARVPDWMPLNRKTLFIQTWHGTPLKKIALDTIDSNNLNEHSAYKKNIARWNYLLAPNPYSKDIFATAFEASATIIESGYPRNDQLINNNHLEAINRLKNELGIPTDKTIILYAPTWRDNLKDDSGNFRFDPPFDLKRLETLANEHNAVFIFRMHYLVSNSLKLPVNSTSLIDLSTNVDISSLYLISDLLITDYSSVFFDYANLHRPMLFYTYDLIDYRDNIRGFYFDIESQAPGPLAIEEDDFFNYLQEYLNYKCYSDYQEKLNDFVSEFCPWDNGESSKKVADIVLQHVNNNQQSS